MIISGISRTELFAVVEKLNAPALYDGNVNVENCEVKNQRGDRLSVKFGTNDSKRHGSRRSWSGRHGKWLCWHGFRDVVRGVMEVNPDAVVRTGLEVYRGKQGFEGSYVATGGRNAGSMVQPAYLPEMCVGTCAGDWE